MKTQITSLILAVAIAGIPATAFAQESPASGQVLPANTTKPELIVKMDEAKNMLKDVRLNYELVPQYKKVTTGSGKKKTTKSVLTGYSLNRRDIAVAVYDPSTGKITIAMAMQKDTTFTFPDPTYDIKAARFNGVNTPFQVNRPVGGMVIALKYLITPIENGSKDEIVKSLYEVIYVPYSSKLNQQDVADYGDAYLNNMIKQAESQLMNIPAASQGGKTVPQAISPALVKALIYAEHMDTTEFLSSSNPTPLINKVNVLFAGNEGDTYKYSVSSANARGISQFIPSTYASLVKRHPEANLTADYVAGMSDHVNAIKATFLLLDDYTASVQNQSAGNFVLASPSEYGVASYNGGVTRIARSIKNFGAQWSDSRSDQINILQAQVTAQENKVNSLTQQIKKAKKKADKDRLTKERQQEQQSLDGLRGQLDTIKASTLRDETIGYVGKIRRLMPMVTVR